MHQIEIGCRKEREKKQTFSQTANIFHNNIIPSLSITSSTMSIGEFVKVDIIKFKERK